MSVCSQRRPFVHGEKGCLWWRGWGGGQATLITNIYAHELGSRTKYVAQNPSQGQEEYKLLDKNIKLHVSYMYKT